VALIPTGDELVPPETEPGPGQIRTPTPSPGGAGSEGRSYPVVMDIVRDNYDSLKATAHNALELADVVVFSAGSSVSTRT